MARTLNALRSLTLVLLAAASITAGVSLQFLPGEALSITTAQTPLLLALLALLCLPGATIASIALSRPPIPARQTASPRRN